MTHFSPLSPGTTALAGLVALGASPLAAQSVSMTVEASAIPAFVAADRGFFGDLEVEVSKVGYDQVQALLVAGDTDIAWMSPIETVQFVTEGSDFRYSRPPVRRTCTTASSCAPRRPGNTPMC